MVSAYKRLLMLPTEICAAEKKTYRREVILNWCMEIDAKNKSIIVIGKKILSL